MDADQLFSDTEIDKESTPTWKGEMYTAYIKWNQDKTPNMEVIKPNAGGKL